MNLEKMEPYVSSEGSRTRLRLYKEKQQRIKEGQLSKRGNQIMEMIHERRNILTLHLYAHQSKLTSREWMSTTYFAVRCENQD